VLGSVPGRRDHRQGDGSDRDHIPVLEARHVWSGGVGGDVLRGSRGLREPAAAGNVVGVKVGLEHMPDLRPRLLGRAQVVADLPLWVDHRGLAAGGDEVRGAPQVVMQDLAEEHVLTSGSMCLRHGVGLRPVCTPSRGPATSTVC
jgi:hypothetical protein